MLQISQKSGMQNRPKYTALLAVRFRPKENSFVNHFLTKSR